MPGNHLNDLERKLSKRWEANNMPNASLLGIEIHGNPGLRGITDLAIEFHYPVTVICGKNGTGKTTLLSLAALGFHRQENFHPKDAKIQVREYDKGSYYTFSNFFYKGPEDSDCLGVEIIWHYKNKSDIAIHKRSEKWMHYERRPSRAVQYLGSSRVISAIEQKTLRTHFKPEKQGILKKPLSQEYIQYLSKILGYNYSDANDLSHESYHIRTCKKNQSYSSFNMGAGEDAIIELLAYIQEMPKDSLCIIEEIELGIHPEALSRLAEVIQQIADAKNMQFIISSHSRDFIDNLPRCARVLLQRFNDNCQVIHGPTTRYAIGAMSIRTEAELYVYCEDDLAKKIILSALPNNIRRRVEVVEIGSKSEFKKVLDYHNTVMPRMKSLLIWDGDVKDNEIKQWFNGDSKLNYFFLHHSNCPEYNILNSLKNNGTSLLTKKLNFENEQEIICLLDSLLRLDDLHDFPHNVSNKTALSEEEVIRIFIDCYKDCSSNDFDKIAGLVRATIDLPAGTFLDNHNRN